MKLFTKVHTDQYEKDKALEQAMSPYFDDMYWRVFKGLVRIEVVSDKFRQKTGIDKILHFENGKKKYVDEKVLEYSMGNFVLEEYSNLEKGKEGKGWLEKTGMQTDYLMYGFFKEKMMFILPYKLVQGYYLANRDLWLEQTQRDPKRKGIVSYYENKEKNPWTTTGFYMKHQVVFDGMEAFYQTIGAKYKTCKELWTRKRFPPRKVQQEIEEQQRAILIQYKNLQKLKK